VGFSGLGGLDLSVQSRFEELISVFSPIYYFSGFEQLFLWYYFLRYEDQVCFFVRFETLIFVFVIF